MTVTEGTAWALSHCNFDPSIVDPLFTYTNQAWATITAVFWFVGLAYGEVHLLSVSIGSVVNVFLHWALMWIVKQPVPDGLCGTENRWCVDPLVVDGVCDADAWPWWQPPPTSNCVPCGFPGKQAQLTAYLIVCVYFYRYAWHSDRMNWLISIFVLGWMALLVFSHLYIGYNSPTQFVAGTLFGTGFGVAWSWFTFLWLYPRYPKFMDNKWVRRVKEYRNTLARSGKPVPGDPPPLLAVPISEKELSFGFFEELDKKNQ